MKLNLKYIKNKRLEKKLTLQEMAEKLGMKDASTYMRYEKGEYALKADIIPKIALILNCDIKDFFKN